MRKLFMAILALAGAVTLLTPVREVAIADVVQKFNNVESKASRAARPLRSSAGGDPDTVWIGHIYDPTFNAGGTMQSGGYGPYHVGRGPNLPTDDGSTTGDNGTWDFDRFQPGETDSLMGWWPLSRPYLSGNVNSQQDFRRSFFCFDYGNQVNYVINQGGPSTVGPDGAINKRTFGVTGLWHRDGSGASASGTAPPIPNLTGTAIVPLAWSGTYVGGAGSTASAWCGVRSHGDHVQKDEVEYGGTGNPFSSALFQYQMQYPRLSPTGSNAANGTDHNFPGYGSQLDQMLYRDITLGSDTAPLTITWNFSTDMSTGFIAAPTGAIAGWFDKDPLSPSKTGIAATLDGNFMSSSSPSPGVCDSFMVYIGAPVNDSAVLLSNWDGVSAKPPVFDKKRRWFSEVLQLNHACQSGNACSIIGKQLASYAGVHAPTSETVIVSDGAGSAGLYETELNAILDADGVNGNGGRVRLVFRIKTNRNSDDENGDAGGFSSGTRGAAIVDNVTWTGGSAADGNFESEGSINNRLDVAATAAWKSTGKPPSVFFHTEDIAVLDYDDPCGGIDDPKRRCNMGGAVVVAGNHDQAGHKNGGPFGSNDQDRQRLFASPTINLANTGVDGVYNAMGIDADIADASGEYILYGSDWTGDYVNATSETGEFRSVAYQCYPSTQANGNKAWSQPNLVPSIFFNGAPPGCFEGAITSGAIGDQTLKTSNASGVPDSIRVVIHRVKRCYSSGTLDDAHCAPTGFLRGSYFDNLSMGLIDGLPPPEVSVPIWYMLSDAFPYANRFATELAPSEWDTAGAQIRTGANQSGTTVFDLTRPNVSSDSSVVDAAGDNVRMDFVFRIEPGPGNYGKRGAGLPYGDQTAQLKKVPQAATLSDPVAPTDGDFWGHYMLSPGTFSQGTHPGAGAAKRWSKHVWNSARMDTAEVNLRPDPGAAELLLLSPGSWTNTYHESDPKFSALGISKSKCYLVDPNGEANSTNIACDGGAGSTKEYTKIIPDGLLVPGAHVQYFFRKSVLGAAATDFEMGPDTNVVIPQASEGSFDGHRWQQFSVLPDFWKDDASFIPTAYAHASAPACMLYIDWHDRRGNEFVWVSLADSIGATASTRRGAHNGWRARGDQDVTVEVGTDPSIAVYTHGGQPGTIWDMYGVKASESFTTGGSLGPATPAVGFMLGKDDARGPTGRMMRYYSVLLILTGDLEFGNIGPFEDKTNDDLGLITDFIQGDDPDDTPKPRGVLAVGQSFMNNLGSNFDPHYLWGLDTFGAEIGYITSPVFSQGNYRFESGNTSDVAEMFPKPPIQSLSDGDRYSVFNDCRNANDWMFPVTNVGDAAGYYPPGVDGDIYVSSVYAAEELVTPPLHEGVTLAEGFDIALMGSLINLTQGRIGYYTKLLTNVYSAICPAMNLGAVSVGGENPNLVNFLALRSENPHRGGNAQINFGITRKEKVELRVYDVTGRLVKVLANREFTAGEHQIFWDGSNEDGRLVPRGVYFYQLRTPSFVSQKKLAVLRH